jgi:hypothetical protein
VIQGFAADISGQLYVRVLIGPSWKVKATYEGYRGRMPVFLALALAFLATMPRVPTYAR